MPPISVPSRLLVVDDSRFMRQAISSLFAGEESIEIVGEAANGAEALEAADQLRPDVVTLDVNMPVMDGLTALKHLMIRSPKPTVMLSTLTKDGTGITFDALRYGALDFVTKPSNLPDENLADQRHAICHKVRLAAGVKVSALRYIRARTQAKQADRVPPKRLVVIGAGEGGYSTLLRIIPHLRGETGNPAAYLVVLYADPAHVQSFARYLDRYSALEVDYVRHGQPIQSGVCYLSSGNEYVTIAPDRGQFVLQVTTAPFPWRRGSINRLLFSAAEVLGAHSVAALLTGSGDDGAEGLSEVAYAGGVTLVQDPNTCLDREMVTHALNLSESSCLCIPDAAIGEVLNELVGV